MERPPCKACLEIHEKRGKEAACDTCTPPLYPENEDAVLVWSLCRNQLLLVPMGGTLDINHLAIHEAMKLYEVADPKQTFEKVLLIVHNIQLKKEGR